MAYQLDIKCLVGLCNDISTYSRYHLSIYQFPQMCYFVPNPFPFVRVPVFYNEIPHLKGLGKRKISQINYCYYNVFILINTASY